MMSSIHRLGFMAKTQGVTSRPYFYLFLNAKKCLRSVTPPWKAVTATGEDRNGGIRQKLLSLWQKTCNTPNTYFTTGSSYFATGSFYNTTGNSSIATSSSNVTTGSSYITTWSSLLHAAFTLLQGALTLLQGALTLLM